MGRIVWEQPGGSAGVENWLAAASGIASGMADSRLRQGAVDLEAQRFERQRTAMREDQNALLDRQVLADQRRMQMQEGIDTRRQERDFQNINLRSQLDEQRAAAKRAYEMGLLQDAASESRKLLSQDGPLGPAEEQALRVFETTGNQALLRQVIEDRQKRRANVEAARPFESIVTRFGPPTAQQAMLLEGLQSGQFKMNDPAVRAESGLMTQTEILAGEREARLVEQARNKRAMQPFITKEETLYLDALEKQYDVAASELAAAEREASNRQMIGQDRTAYLAEFQQRKNDAYGRWMNTYAQIVEQVGGRQQGGSRLPPMQVPPPAQPPQTLNPAVATALGVDTPSPAAPLGTVKAGPNKGRPVGPAPGGGFMLPSGRSVPDGFATPPEVKAALQQAIQAGTLQPGSLQLQAEYLRLLDEYMAAREPGLLERVGNSVRGVFGG